MDFVFIFKGITVMSITASKRVKLQPSESFRNFIFELGRAELDSQIETFHRAIAVRGAFAFVANKKSMY